MFHICCPRGRDDSHVYNVLSHFSKLRKFIFENGVVVFRSCKNVESIVICTFSFYTLLFFYIAFVGLNGCRISKSLFVQFVGEDELDDEDELVFRVASVRGEDFEEVFH